MNWTRAWNELKSHGTGNVAMGNLYIKEICTKHNCTIDELIEHGCISHYKDGWYYINSDHKF